MSNSPEDKQKKSSRKIFKLYDAVPDCDSPLISEEDLESLKQGIYTAKYPLLATKKIFIQICRHVGNFECGYTFSIQEVTENSNFKIYDYAGKRKKLDEPKEVNVRGTIQMARYQFTVTGVMLSDERSVNIKGTDE